MKLEIEFKMDNAAFGDDYTVEANRIIQEVGERVLNNGIHGYIHDINGGLIGEYRVTE